MLAIIMPYSGPKTSEFEGLTSGCTVTVNHDAGRQSFKSLCLCSKLCVPSIYLSLSILWSGVQPILDTYSEAFYSRPTALTLGGEEFSVNDVCKCMRDCRVGWAE